jgi:tetratricopeptide (TPR) repeat protein
LAARIDRLLPEDKRLLQAAAVIGTDVQLSLLQSIAEDSGESFLQSLERLQAGEFLYEARLFPEIEYTFKHALTYETALNGLLQSRRSKLHGRILTAMEQLYADRLGEHVERLAHHALRAELLEKAVHYLRAAGEKSAARSALADALIWFEQAIVVLDGLTESRSALEQSFEIRLAMRPVLFQLGDARRALEPLLNAEALAERLDDDSRRGRVCAFITSVYTQIGELDEALVAGARALEIAGRLGDLRQRILTTSIIEVAHYYRCDYERVVALATDNLAALPAEWIYEHLGIAAPTSVYDRCFLVMSLTELGRFTEAAKYEAEAIRIAEPTQHAYTLGMAYRAACTLSLLKGEWATARSLNEQCIAALRPANVILLLPGAVAASAWVSAQVGEVSEALNRLQEGEQLVERRAVGATAPQLGWDYLALGRANLLIGRLDEARRLGDRAVKSSLRQPGFAAHAFHLLGDVATHADRFDDKAGESHYRHALALAEPRGMRPLVALCHFGLGKLHRRTGDREEAQEHLNAAMAMFREMGMTYWLEHAEAELRQLG